jgi:hypothetical protein
MVVLPALSKPRIRIRTSLEPKRVSKILLNMIPILERLQQVALQGSQHTSQSHPQSAQCGLSSHSVAGFRSPFVNGGYGTLSFY